MSRSEIGTATRGTVGRRIGSGNVSGVRHMYPSQDKLALGGYLKHSNFLSASGSRRARGCGSSATLSQKPPCARLAQGAILGVFHNSPGANWQNPLVSSP